MKKLLMISLFMTFFVGSFSIQTEENQEAGGPKVESTTKEQAGPTPEDIAAKQAAEVAAHNTAAVEAINKVLPPTAPKESGFSFGRSAAKPVVEAPINEDGGIDFGISKETTIPRADGSHVKVTTDENGKIVTTEISHAAPAYSLRSLTDKVGITAPKTTVIQHFGDLHVTKVTNEGLFDAASKKMSSLKSSAKLSASRAGDKISSTVSSATSSYHSALFSARDSITSTASSVKNSVGSAAGAKDSITSTASKVKDSVSSVASGVKDSISSVASKVKDRVSSTNNDVVKTPTDTEPLSTPKPTENLTTNSTPVVTSKVTQKTDGSGNLVHVISHEDGTKTEVRSVNTKKGGVVVHKRDANGNITEGSLYASDGTLVNKVDLTNKIYTKSDGTRTKLNTQTHSLDSIEPANHPDLTLDPTLLPSNLATKITPIA